MPSIVTLNGYRIQTWRQFERTAPADLIGRAKEHRANFVLWDPHSDADGYLLCGNDIAKMVAEFEDHFGDDLAKP